ncbi:MAG: aldo/keto reductase [Bacillota bacterium]|nr:aldo/keto reductase [Bacillota bacterium]
MNSLTSTYRLNNGIDIPCVGFGTWQAENGDQAYKAVRAAIDAGYRHIDTAAAYGNEESIGKAVRDSGIPREEIFITSKLRNFDHGYAETLAAFDLTMQRLGLDYLDLYLIHWPNPARFRECWQETNAASWKAFEELYQAGRIRSIGISNFRPHHMDELLKTATIVPMVNQIRLCPGDTQDETVAYCRERNILLEAYSPLGTGKVFDVPELQEMAKKYNKTIAQISLRWSLQMGFLPLPKSTTPSRIKENADLFDFELTAEDTAFLAGLKDCCGTASDPDKIGF